MEPDLARLQKRGLEAAPPPDLHLGSSSAVDAGGYSERSTGISVSRDGGNTWRQANEGLSWPFANVVRIDPQDPAFVVAACPGLGVQIRRFGDVAGPAH